MLLHILSWTISNRKASETSMSKYLSVCSGLHANLPEERIPGRLLVTEDEHELFVDIDEETRIQIQDTTKDSFFVRGTQTASTNAFKGVLEGVDSLYEGLAIDYYLPYAGTSTAATLVLTLDSGNTSSVPIYYTYSTRLTTHIGAQSVIPMVYMVVNKVGRWMVKRGYNSDNYDRTLIQNTKFTAGSGGILARSIIAEDSEGKFQSLSISANSSQADNLQIGNTSAKFKLEPTIYYYTSAAAVSAGSQIRSTTVTYSTYSNIDITYFTTFETRPQEYRNVSVYVECTIDEDGYWSPTESWLICNRGVQSGKYYIYLGNYNNAANYMNLSPVHPVYYCNSSGNLIDYNANALKVAQQEIAFQMNEINSILKQVPRQIVNHGDLGFGGGEGWTYIPGETPSGSQIALTIQEDGTLMFGSYSTTIIGIHGLTNRISNNTRPIAIKIVLAGTQSANQTVSIATVSNNTVTFVKANAKCNCENSAISGASMRSATWSTNGTVPVTIYAILDNVTNMDHIGIYFTPNSGGGKGIKLYSVEVYNNASIAEIGYGIT